MSRTIAEIPAELVACYEWKPFPEHKPKAADNDHCFAVSTPSDPDLKHQVGIWDGKIFRTLHHAPIIGVTYWVGLPATPEEQLAELAAEKAAARAADPTPELFPN